MHVVIVGAEPPQALLDALAAEHLEPRPWPQAKAGGVVGLTSALREAEESLECERPSAVLATDASDAALMGAVTAVKRGIPTAALVPADGASLPARIAHLALPATDDPPAIASAVKGLAGPTLSRP